MDGLRRVRRARIRTRTLRITVLVESRSPRGLFAVADDDFLVQDVDGFVTTGEVIQTAEQAAAEQEAITEVELAEGESTELALSFEIVSGVAPQALFFAPESGRLVTVTPLG